MDLYDDIDTKPRAGQIDGWSSGIKMLQTQLVIKNKTKEQIKRPALTPVSSLRAKRPPPPLAAPQIVPLSVQYNDGVANTKSGDNNAGGPPPMQMKPTITAKPLEPVLQHTQKADDWDFVDEYDPQWPNEYDKLKEKHQSKERGGRSGGGGGGGGNNNRGDRSSNEDRKRSRRSGGNDSRDHRDTRESPPAKFSGFGGHRQNIIDDDYSPPSAGPSKSGGAAIAPPPSLQEISINNESGDGSSNVTIPYSASSVAAKIMAKYGFRDGQGLGKQEQGMAMALQVEKTSKRGGRIIHEKDVFLPPPPAVGGGSSGGGPSAPGGGGSGSGGGSPGHSPVHSFNMAPPPAPLPLPAAAATASAAAALNNDTSPPAMASEPSITEIMKDPSKVVLLRNMVGPGDVDEELEPEVKDECNTKYGDVTSVLIHEAFGTTPEDAVKIFVEFKRIESAIKAVVDLNGRFFGGRQVRAGFYNYDKFKSFQLH